MSRLVVKLGGSVLIDDALRQSLISQIAELHGTGYRVIIVHGGGKQIASLLGRLDISSRFHDGLRVTDRAIRDVAQMVLAGQVGKDLIRELARSGLNAASIAGGDGSSFLAEKINAEDGTDLGFVGRITRSNAKLIDVLLAADIIPVIACLALGATDYEYYNINGDQMAAAVAASCSADQLIFVTDVGGVRDHCGKRIPRLDRIQIYELLDSGVAGGGMRPKLRACLEALDQGVKRIAIIGATEEDSLTRVINLAVESPGTQILMKDEEKHETNEK
jgi:acetylglutamate kinase